jgi:hypothetical protein
MKKMIRKDIGNYSFNPVNRTITFFNITLLQEQILTIVNTIDGIMIYCFADPILKGSFDGQILTLDYNTSLMSDNDPLQIYVDMPDVNETKTILNQVNIGDTVLFQNTATGELYTQDINLATVFGQNPLNTNDGYLKTKNKNDSKQVVKGLRVLGDCVGIECSEYSSVTIELSGTWTGTVSFEGRTDTGNFIALTGMAVNVTTLLSSSTANGIFKFNCTGLSQVQARVSAALSAGSVFVTINASSNVDSVFLSKPISGSQSQPLTQRATSFELNTFDTNLSTVLGNAVLYRLGNLTTLDPIVAPTVNITQATTYADNRYAKYPQISPRVRVESAGSEKLPFAQEMVTNRQLIAYPELLSMLEKILLQIMLLNDTTCKANNITPNVNFEELK